MWDEMQKVHIAEIQCLTNLHNTQFFGQDEYENMYALSTDILTKRESLETNV